MTPYLANLLQNEKYIYNKAKYQSNDEYSMTCGFHVTHRTYRLFSTTINLRIPWAHENNKDEYKISYDVIVAILLQWN